MSLNTIPTTFGDPPARSSSPSAIRRFASVVAQPETYRSIAYLLLGLPLGTIWFSALITGASVGISLLVVALVGIPILIGVWWTSRALANVERTVANALVDQHLPLAPMCVPGAGNMWVRLRSMTRDPQRWRELGYLVLRLPVGIATFTAAVVALAVPAVAVSVPIVVRLDDDEPFGEWALSSWIEDVAATPWAWSLVPVGVATMVASMHLLNALAWECGRWSAAWLTDGPSRMGAVVSPGQD